MYVRPVGRTSSILKPDIAAQSCPTLCALIGQLIRHAGSPLSLPQSRRKKQHTHADVVAWDGLSHDLRAASCAACTGRRCSTATKPPILVHAWLKLCIFYEASDSLDSLDSLTAFIKVLHCRSSEKFSRRACVFVQHLEAALFQMGCHTLMC